MTSGLDHRMSLRVRGARNCYTCDRLRCKCSRVEKRTKKRRERDRWKRAVRDTEVCEHGVEQGCGQCARDWGAMSS